MNRAEVLRAAVARVVDRLAPRRGGGRSTEVAETARRAGAVDVLYNARCFDGYTIWSDFGPIIQVAMARTDGRRRATLAHEVGHLIVDPVVRTESFATCHELVAARHTRRVDRLLGQEWDTLVRLEGSFGVERLCDLIAFELLLPESEMAVLSSFVCDLPSLKLSCDKMRVSLTAMVNRLNEFEGDLALLQLRRSPRGEWLTTPAAGVRGSLQGRVVCLGTLEADLSALGRRPRTSTLRFRGTSSSFEVSAEVWRRSASFALVLTSRSALRDAVPERTAPTRVPGQEPSGSPE